MHCFVIDRILSKLRSPKKIAFDLITNTKPSFQLFYRRCEVQTMKLIAVLLFVFSQFASEDAFKIQPRIRNGYTASDRQFPYYVFLNIALTTRGNFSCGGTLLSDEFILTAAHCTYYASEIEVHLGTENLDYPRHMVVNVGKENIFMHPLYVKRFSWNDLSELKGFNFDFERNLYIYVQQLDHFFILPLGLIKMPNKVRLSMLVRPIRLPTSCKIADDTEVIIMGNGDTSETSSMSPHLRFTHLKTISRCECRRTLPHLWWRRSTVCAYDKGKDHESASSACYGDSGSPLVTVNGTLLGVLSLSTARKIQINTFPTILLQM